MDLILTLRYGEMEREARITAEDPLQADEAARLVKKVIRQMRLERDYLVANNPKGTGNGSRKTTGDTREAPDR